MRMLTLELLYLYPVHCILCILSQYNPRPTENYENIEENITSLISKHSGPLGQRICYKEGKY